MFKSCGNLAKKLLIDCGFAQLDVHAAYTPSQNLGKSRVLSTVIQLGDHSLIHNQKAAIDPILNKFFTQFPQSLLLPPQMKKKGL